MNEPLNPTPREALEAKITALLLGELTPAEEAEVRQALQADAALRELHDQLARTTALLKDAAAPARAVAENSHAPRQLSDDRRRRLLEKFRIVVPLQFELPARKQTAWLVPMSIAAALVLLLGIAGLAPGFFAPVRPKSVTALSISEHAYDPYFMQSRGDVRRKTKPATGPEAEGEREREELVNVLPKGGTATRGIHDGDVADQKTPSPAGTIVATDGSAPAALAVPEVMARSQATPPPETGRGRGDQPTDAERFRGRALMERNVANISDSDLAALLHAAPTTAQSSISRADLNSVAGEGVQRPAMLPRYELAPAAPAPNKAPAASDALETINGRGSATPASRGGFGGGGFGGRVAGGDEGKTATLGGIAQNTVPEGAQSATAAAGYGLFAGRPESPKAPAPAAAPPPPSAALGVEAARATEMAQKESKQQELDRGDRLLREAAQTEWAMRADAKQLGETQGRELRLQVEGRPSPESPQLRAGQPPGADDSYLFDFETLARRELRGAEVERVEVLGKKVAETDQRAVEPSETLAFAVPIEGAVKMTPLADAPPAAVAVRAQAAQMNLPAKGTPVLGDVPLVGRSFKKLAPLPTLALPTVELKRELEALGQEKAPAQQPPATESKPAGAAGGVYKVNVVGFTPALGSTTNQLAQFESAEKKSVDDEVRDKAVPERSSSVVHQPEVLSAENAFSTFSLNVADVSFKLAAASLEQGQLPDPAAIRVEEFINALDYRDPEPPPGARVGFLWERARYPFAHNRDLIRFSVKTAAVGRQPGRPLNLVLLLDNSGSMERADRVRILRQALEVLAGQLTTEDRISVVAFARRARLWIDGLAGGNPQELRARVGDLTPQGGTNLEDALNLAYEIALRHAQPQSVNRVVLLTDGAANLGDVNPDSLQQKVEAHRKRGVALDCFGVGWEGYNDDLLEILARHGDGRYGFLSTPDEAATEFAGQLAGALRVAAADVKAQVEFNPRRVIGWRQIGYAKHQLKKEQFRDNTVDAAEIGGAEAGNALYTLQIDPAGQGPIGFVRVRCRVPETGAYEEQEWLVPYLGTAPRLEEGSPAMRLAAAAGAFGEWLAGSPFAGEVTNDALANLVRGVPAVFAPDPRPERLEAMVRQAKALAGR